MNNVLIAGGTGLIGSYLCTILKSKGYSVSLLSRSKQSKSSHQTYVWDIQRDYIDDNAVKNADYIINLTGASIADKRWDLEQKEAILQSRTKSIKLISGCLARNKHNVKGFFSASAVGYYGNHESNKTFTEKDPPSDDFLSQVCFKWEKAVKEIEQQKIRTVILRTGVVLSNEGGAFVKMLQPVKLGFGTAVGSGKQNVPWIHIHDLCMIYLKAIEDKSMQGVYNGVAPEFQTNYDFTKAMCRSLKRPFWPIKVPAFVLKIVLGEMAQLVLKGNKVSSAKIVNSGFEFLYPTIKEAFWELLNKKNK